MWWRKRQPIDMGKAVNGMVRTMTAELPHLVCVGLVWTDTNADPDRPTVRTTFFRSSQVDSVAQAYRDFLDIYNPSVGTVVESYVIMSDGEITADRLTVKEARPPRNRLVGRYERDYTLGV